MRMIVDCGYSVQVVDLMGQDMVVYRVDNGVGTQESKVCSLCSVWLHALLIV